jgi:hypothetical protein
MLLVVAMENFIVFLVEKGFGFKLRPQGASVPTSGAMGACRGAAPFVGDEDDRETLVWTTV